MSAVVAFTDTVTGLRIVLPVTPAEVSESISADVRSFQVVGSGTHSFPLGRGERTFPLAIWLPGYARRGLPLVNQDAWWWPEERVALIREWVASGRRLAVDMADINLDVYLKQATIRRAGGYGDIFADLELTEWRPLTIRLDGDEDAGVARDEPAIPGIYTVVEDDHWMLIAQKVYGRTNRWKEIWLANRDLTGPAHAQLEIGWQLFIPGGTAIPAQTESTFNPNGLQISPPVLLTP